MRKIAVFAIAAAFFGCGFWAARTGETAFAAENQTNFPLAKMREFTEVFRIIKENYVEEVADETLMENAIRGMLDGLDPHSAYLPAQSVAAFEKSIHAEEYGGVGIYIGERDGWVEVISPIDDTPAARAGLLPGDIIVRIQGQSTQGMEINAAVGLIRGEINSTVSLDILTPGEEGARTVALRREKIVAPTAVAALAEPDYGYLRINRFQRETVEDAVKAIDKLYDENGGPLRGLVLDLRNNPGGLLETSVGVASIFLPEGVTVVSDRSRGGANHLLASASYHRGLDNADEIKRVRMVALVNNGSASASEIVAGALQDHKRALILGQRTYGKASVQSFLRLPSSSNKTAVKLTTARYFTPHDRSIQAVGITPDIPVFAANSVQEEEETGIVFRESDLAGHLENTQTGTGVNGENADENADAETPFIPRDDYQYDQALVVLKALAIGG